MLKVTDIIMDDEDIKGYNRRFGYIDLPLKIFGQIRFSDSDNKLGIDIDKSIKISDYIDSLNEYLDWLSDCKSVLIDGYKRINSYIINEYYDGEMTDDWFETLEMYSGSVSINPYGFSAVFSCGDNMSQDHLLMIEIENKEIKDLWFDG